MLFKINHCHFSENNNRILCNQNSLGSGQRQGTRLSPAFNYKIFTLQKIVHVTSGTRCLHFEAVELLADWGFGHKERAQEYQAQKALDGFKCSKGRKYLCTWTRKSWPHLWPVSFDKHLSPSLRILEKAKLQHNWQVSSLMGCEPQHVFYIASSK